MKNRLELAKKFLRDDGLIFVQCDDKEQAYLKVLMDEIFMRENFVNNICVKMSEASGKKMAHVDKRLVKLKEYILVYKKNNIKLSPLKTLKEEWDGEYKTMFLNFTKEERECIKKIAVKEDITEEDIEKVDSILEKVEIINVETELKNIKSEEKRKKWLFENSYRIFRTTSSSSVKKLVDEKKKTTTSKFISVKSKRDGLLYIAKTDYNDLTKSPRVQVLFADDYTETILGDLWSDINTTGLDNEGEVELKNAKKPELIIKRIIDLTTDTQDIILDFYLGSGTTTAVAHKMNRKYIGIEQLDYIETKTLERMKGVLNGEQGGISKELGWQGGGSFVYCELKEDSISLISKIQTSTEETILGIKEEIFNDDRIIPYITKNELKMANDEFEQLSFEDKKNILIRLVNKNKLYVNYSEINDEKYNISKVEKKFTNSFYKEVE